MNGSSLGNKIDSRYSRTNSMIVFNNYHCFALYNRQKFFGASLNIETWVFWKTKKFIVSRFALEKDGKRICPTKSILWTCWVIWCYQIRSISQKFARDFVANLFPLQLIKFIQNHKGSRKSWKFLLRWISAAKFHGLSKMPIVISFQFRSIKATVDKTSFILFYDELTSFRLIILSFSLFYLTTNQID